MITYDGKVYGNEVMPMVALADEIAAGNKPNPYLQVFPQAEKYSTSGFQTTHTFSAVSGALPGRPRAQPDVARRRPRVSAREREKDAVDSNRARDRRSVWTAVDLADLT